MKAYRLNFTFFLGIIYPKFGEYFKKLIYQGYFDTLSELNIAILYLVINFVPIFFIVTLFFNFLNFKERYRSNSAILFFSIISNYLTFVVFAISIFQTTNLPFLEDLLFYFSIEKLFKFIALILFFQISIFLFSINPKRVD